MKQVHATIATWGSYSVCIGIATFFVSLRLTNLHTWTDALNNMHGNCFSALIMTLSAGLAGWMCKLQKGEQKLWTTGLVTWCFFAVFIFLPFLLFHIENKNLGGTATALDGFFLIILVTSILSLPSIFLGTVMHKCIIHSILKYADRPLWKRFNK